MTDLVTETFFKIRYHLQATISIRFILYHGRADMSFFVKATKSIAFSVIKGLLKVSHKYTTELPETLLFLNRKQKTFSLAFGYNKRRNNF